MYDTVAAVGVETTGGDDRFEVAAAVFRNGAVTATFDARVGPEGSSATARDAIAGLTAFLPGDALCLAHEAGHTLSFLAAACGLPFPHRMLDTAALSRICLPGLPAYDLDALAESAGLLGEQLPTRLAPARCELTLRLWQVLVRTAFELPDAALRAVCRVLPPRHDDWIRAFFRDVAASPERPLRGPASARLGALRGDGPLPKPRRALPDPSTYARLDPGTVAELLGPDGPFAARLPGYECREEQQHMARAVVEAFNGSTHLLVEAGTGVGKSLAYAVPAVLWATTNRTPVVISTHTKNLQAQLFQKDIPLVRQTLDASFSAALIKGRQNYLCLRKLYGLQGHSGELAPAQREALAAMVVWAGATATGDLSEVMAGPGESDGDWTAELTSTREECRGPECPDRRSCFLYRARRKALAADVIVANHAVVIREMGEEDNSPVLPPYAHLVLDEAHNIEDAATGILSREVSQPKLRFILRRLCRPARGRRRQGFVPRLVRRVEAARGLDASQAAAALEHGRQVMELVDGIESAARPFFSHLGEIPMADGRQDSLRIHPERKTGSWWGALEAARAALSREMERLRQALAALSGLVKGLDPKAFPEGEDDALDLDAAVIWLSELADSLTAVFDRSDGNGVSWVERALPAHGGSRAWSAPIRVGPSLAESLYSRKQSVIFTSATLTAGGSFTFMRSRLGVDCLGAGRTCELVFGTPFDYARQCRVMVPTFLPEPGEKDGEYAAELGRLLAEVFRCTRGRGLVLFTSFDMLRRASRVLQAAMAGDGIRILEQGVSGSRETITDEFRRDIQSVLLGAQSFWEGVDVVGESLSCLVVARLPFAVFTDPVVEARSERIEAEGGNAFMDYAVPSAVIRFRQGFGRLIRHRTDRGVVIVADRRIAEKRYGHWFRRSLPAPTVSIPDRQVFLEGLRAFFDEDPGI